MKIKIDEFRPDRATELVTPLDFETLCAALAAHQAATPTARAARDDGEPADPRDQTHAAVAALRASPGQGSAIGPTHGSFHAAAAARFNEPKEK